MVKRESHAVSGPIMNFSYRKAFVALNSEWLFGRDSIDGIWHTEGNMNKKY